MRTKSKMPEKTKEVNMDSMKDMLKRVGSKLTPQRLSILDVIIEQEGNHLTIEEIYEIVKKNKPQIGVATVYRTIQLFEEVGLVSKLDLNDGLYRYELNHEEETHNHHHLVCNDCGKVMEVDGDLLDDVEDKIEKEYSFSILNHSLKFFGLCKDCKESKGKEKENDKQ